MVFDLTCLATRNANLRSRNSASVGARLVTTFSVMSSTTALSRLCTNSPPATVLAVRPLPRGDDRNGLVGCVGRNDDFGQDFRNGACGIGIERAVDGNDAAIGRLGVA